MIFIADLIACSTCFGHHYAHHQELESVIQVVAACGIWCFCIQVVGMVWSWGLCVRFAGFCCCSSPQTGPCWTSNRICNKNHLLHLDGILFPHINDDSRLKSHQKYCFVCLFVSLSGYRDIYRFFTFLLTPCSRVLLEKLIVSQLLKKSTAFYGTRRFIAALAIARYLYLSWNRSAQSTRTPPPPLPSCFLKIRFNIILPSTPFLYKPKENISCKSNVNWQE